MDYGYGDGAAAGAFLATFYAIYFSSLAIVLFIALIVYVLNGFAFMALFRKLGVEPWAAWVPFFNFWRLLELGAQPGWISLLALVNPGGIVAAVFECIAAHRIGIAFRKDGAWVALFLFFPYAWAWLLARDTEVYDLSLLAARGYPPPLVGYGSVRGPYVPPSAPPAPPAPPAA